MAEVDMDGKDPTDWDRRRRQLYDAINRFHYVDTKPDLKTGEMKYGLTLRGSMHAVNLALAKGIALETLTPERKLSLVVYGES